MNDRVMQMGRRGKEEGVVVVMVVVVGHLLARGHAGDSEGHAGAVADVRVEALGQQRHDAGNLLGGAGRVSITSRAGVK